MRSSLRGVSRNVLLLGLVSLFGDVSSEMVVPLLPAFLVALGGGAEAVEIIEGAAEATASLFKSLSGRWADRVRRLLPVAVAGYGLAALVRPLLAIAQVPWHVFAVRCVDRVGKGVRTSPRDKLLAASADSAHLAEAYSFDRGMDHLGAAIGPLVAAALLLLWPGRLRLVFALAAIPGALAVAALFAVRETPADRVATRESRLADRTENAPGGGGGQGTPRCAGGGAETANRVPPRLPRASFVFTLGNS